MYRKPFETGARVTPSKGKVSALRGLVREGCASGAGIKRIRVACNVAPGAAPSCCVTAASAQPVRCSVESIIVAIMLPLP
jgi:hypothetical protein